MHITYRTLGLALGAAVLTAGLTACGGGSAETESTGDKAKDSAKGDEKPEAKDSPEPANGVEKLSGAEVAKKALTAMQGAGSLTVDLNMKDDKGETNMVLSVTEKNDCAGTFVLPTGGKAEFVKRGDKAWLKPDQDFWDTAAGPEAKSPGGRWVAGGADDKVLRDITGTCDYARITNDRSLGKSDGWSDPKESSADGRRTVLVQQESDGTTAALQVATEGEPYPVEVVKVGKQNGTLKYSGFGAPLAAKAPGAGETVDLADLGKIED